jgi:predicted AlkP superfamily phosphohydrolase/phosphomutase
MSRVLVIGWDGGTWSIAAPLATEGRLPALSALRADGAEGVLDTVPNMNSAPAWSTIVTGKNPGKHGIFYFDEPVPETYRRRVVNASRRTGPTLWRLASDAGKRIVAVNVPISYPAEPVNGYFVAGLDTPSKSLPGFTYPEGLTRRLPELFDDYIVEPGIGSLARAGKWEEAKRQLYVSVDGWASVTSRLMDEEWDLVFVVFTPTDMAQHFFWNGENRKVVERVYEIHDEHTAALVEKARRQDPDVNVVVVADHGGAVNTRGPEFMPIWLEDQGFTVKTKPSLKSKVLKAGFDLANRTLTREQKQAMARRLPRLREQAESESVVSGMDWGGTRAYSDGLRDEVWINAAGREPEGIVAEDEYETFAKELAEALSEIREVGTGRTVLDSARPRSELYHGPYLERAPDITLRFALDVDRYCRGFEVGSGAARERMEEVSAKQPPTSGGHSPEGMFVAKGPNVRPEAVHGRLEDLTPTVLALLGVPVPADLDGRVLDFLQGLEPEMADASKGPSPVEVALGPDPQQDPNRDPATGYTEEEEEAVRRRLEDLGYL